MKSAATPRPARAVYARTWIAMAPNQTMKLALWSMSTVPRCGTASNTTPVPNSVSVVSTSTGATSTRISGAGGPSRTYSGPRV